MLKNGGLTIKTTIDMTAQQAADNAVAAHVNPTDGAIGALAMVEPGTGNVLALAQSRPMGNRKKQGETYLNFTVPKEYGDANGFQAGSTFKVFMLAAALGQGLPLTTQFDSPAADDLRHVRLLELPGLRARSAVSTPRTTRPAPAGTTCTPGPGTRSTPSTSSWRS